MGGTWFPQLRVLVLLANVLQLMLVCCMIDDRNSVFEEGLKASIRKSTVNSQAPWTLQCLENVILGVIQQTPQGSKTGALACRCTLPIDCPSTPKPAPKTSSTQLPAEPADSGLLRCRCHCLSQLLINLQWRLYWMAKLSWPCAPSP